MLPTFFKAILGEHGASMMESLSKASEELHSYLEPRIIVSWLRQSDYGDISLHPDCPIQKLNKSGYGYSGIANIDSFDYTFSNSSEEHIAAIVSVALGKSVNVVEVKDIDLAKLAKTIDLLIKAQIKSSQFIHTKPADNIQPEQRIQPDTDQPSLDEAEGKSKKLTIPKVTKKPLKITKSESRKSCEVCGLQMFKNDVFVGCTCFNTLAKNTKTTIINKDTLMLSFDPEWDDDAVLALIGALKNG